MDNDRDTPPSIYELPLREILTAALTFEDFLTPKAADEAAFHLTDWFDELVDLAELLRHPDSDQGELQKAIISFVSHAPHHMAAAHKLVMDLPITDVFEIGAVQADA